MTPCYGDCAGMDEYYGQIEREKQRKELTRLRKKTKKDSKTKKELERLVEKLEGIGEESTTKRRIAELEIEVEDLEAENESFRLILLKIGKSTKALRPLIKKANANIDEILEECKRGKA